MRKISICVFLAFFLLLSSCDNDQGPNSGDSYISILETIPGGCNTDEDSELKDVDGGYPDTVYSFIVGDTLNLHVGINYICCAPFTSASCVSGDTLLMELSDTCDFAVESCYCRCMCYYTWDFRFLYFEGKKYHYTVKLTDPRIDSTIIFRQGVIDLSD